MELLQIPPCHPLQGALKDVETTFFEFSLLVFFFVLDDFCVFFCGFSVFFSFFWIIFLCTFGHSNLGQLKGTLC